MAKTKTERHKDAMVEAMEKHLGIVTSACRSVGITRVTHYQWMKDDPKYKERIEDIGEVAIDFVESQLHQRIQKGDTTACIFYLKTKGKKRGYGDHMAIDHSIEKMPEGTSFGITVHRKKED